MHQCLWLCDWWQGAADDDVGEIFEREHLPVSFPQAL
jgi:hypothetical protein